MRLWACVVSVSVASTTACGTPRHALPGDEPVDLDGAGAEGSCPPGYHWQEMTTRDFLTGRERVFSASCVKDSDADDQPPVNPGTTPDSRPSQPQTPDGLCAAPASAHNDDQDCIHVGSGGVSGFPQKFVTCIYNCGGTEHLIILPSGMVRCPGSDSRSGVKWKIIKGYRRRY